MNHTSVNDKPTDQPEPSAGPLKNEPTPERAAEEKQKQRQHAENEQAAEIAKPKPSGAV
jgi:hypothetical protein